MDAREHTLSGAEWLYRMKRGFDPSPLPVVNPGERPQYHNGKETAVAELLPPHDSATMVTDIQPMKITSRIESTLAEIPWTRTIAAGSFVVGALLLISGRRKSAIAVSAAGAAVALLESPETVRELWNSMPRVIRSGQDFLVRVEDFVEELNKQGQNIRKVLVHD